MKTIRAEIMAGLRGYGYLYYGKYCTLSTIQHLISTIHYPIWILDPRSTKQKIQHTVFSTDLKAKANPDTILRSFKISFNKR